MRLDVAVDLDDTPLTADLAKIGGGPYVSWHLTFRYGGSEIAFEASDVADIEEVLDSLMHQLTLLKSGATRTVEGRVAS